MQSCCKNVQLHFQRNVKCGDMIDLENFSNNYNEYKRQKERIKQREAQKRFIAKNPYADRDRKRKSRGNQEEQDPENKRKKEEEARNLLLENNPTYWKDAMQKSRKKQEEEDPENKRKEKTKEKKKE